MKPHALCLACILSAPAALWSPAFAQNHAAPDATQVPVDAKELGAKLDAHILKNHLGQFWGQVLVARGGEIILAKGYGVANDSLRALDSHTLMDIGSISKQFTAAAILKLEMQGKLSTDDKVSKFFPDAGGAADRITLYQLLTHTSGLNERGTIQSLAFPDRDRAVSLTMKTTLKHEPGETFEYCNGGYVVLGAVVEKASGAKFE
ncbi:MAG: serine hydrolase domain-containing protein, partial [Phycisphaerales bacterium]